MDFKKFITEETKKTAVMAFGRFNPVTTGHEKLMHKVHDTAKKVGGEAHIIASHSEGDARNPIPHKKKLEYIKKVAKPGTHVSGSSKEAPSILHQAVKLHDKGVKHLHIVGGSDRVNGFHDMLKKYNGEKNRHGHYKFDSITKHSSGERDPDSEDVSGMSGTKMRAHAKAGEHEKFKSGLPKALHPHADEMINHIKSAPEKKAKVKEGYEVKISKYEWGTPEGTKHMKDMTPGEKKNKKTKTVVEVQHMHDRVKQDSDIGKRKGTQPAKYHSGLSKSTKQKRDAQFKRQAKMDDRDPSAYKPAPGDKTAKTKPSVHTIAYKKKFGEEKIPMLLRKPPLKEEKHDQVTMDGVTTKAFDICPGAVKAFNNNMVMYPTEVLKSALLNTDNYLTVEKRAAERGYATQPEMYEFLKHYTAAYEDLENMGVIDEHEEYMQGHMDAMEKLSKDFYMTNEEINLHEAKGLAAKAKASGISLGTLRKVYNRGMAAWKTGHRPGTTPQQWAMARVNSYINKGKGTYHGADKDLREQEDIMTEQDLDAMANSLTWEDIVDYYDDDELIRESVISEALSAQQRLKKKQTFARYRGKRGIARGLKLKRTSDMSTLKRRANLAARRALYKRFLRGRNKASLSPAEKDRLEKQVTNLGKTGLQKSLAQKMLPMVRKIEQKRIASYRAKKK